MSQAKRNTASPVKPLSGSAEKQKQLQANTSDNGTTLTTNQGLQIADNHNSLKAGARGPTLLEDFILREKLTHFAHERTAERVVNARGTGAHGYFKVYKPFSQFTSAGFLQNPEVETPVFVRFSTMAGSRGSADTVRDVRGFAVKFYTDQGNYDLVGSNVPVFYVQDAIKFPDLIHALKPEPHSDMPQASSAHDTFWDFASLMPESTHMLMWAMSDRTIPRSYRMMEGFGVNTFRFINSRGDAHFVKFHWKPKLGVHSLAWDEAQKIAGKDADFHRRDLWDAIDAGNFPEWELGVQVVEEGKEGKLGFDILDPTKLIPESVVPVQIIGKMVLNRNPDNFYAETEQVAFNPGHLVPGIDFSADPLLQGRLFSYTDSQLSRLGGANFHEIPINKAVCPFHNFQRDGLHRQTVNKGRVAYEPNTLATGSEFRVDGGEQGFQSHPEQLESPKIRRRSPSFDDHFSHATLFWNSQSPSEKDHIVSAFRYELSRVEVADIRQRMVDNLAHVDSKLAARVASGLGINAPDAKAAAGRLGFRDYKISNTVEQDPALSMTSRPAPDIKTRKVAILVADGVDLLTFKRLQLDLQEAGAQCKLIAPQLGTVTTSSGKQLAVDQTFATSTSLMFDAVVIPGGADSAAALSQLGDAVHFVLEAYKHCKSICALDDGTQLMATLGFALKGNGDKVLEPTVGVLLADARKAPEGQISQTLIAAIACHRHWERLNVDAIPA
ncbi:MAG TPA: catalase [Polaromonas sp.]|uniref:catalase n=1 Tax=Polaromonas sp. TaxID=1869339 RepID=UPI002D5496AA|nr:catalase [Polaromonas sp.]HYW57289.1 catalase [Polaromonas sp.]